MVIDNPDRDASCYFYPLIVTYAKTKGISEDVLINGLAQYQPILRNPLEWIDVRIMSKVFENFITASGGDEESLYQAGIEITKTQTSQMQLFFLKLAPMSLIYKAVSKHAKSNITTAMDMFVHQIDKGKAEYIVRPTSDPSKLSRNICVYNKACGMGTVVLKGYKNLRVKEISCAAKGDPECIYYYTWDPEFSLIEKAKQFFNFSVRDHQAILSHMQESHQNLQEQHQKITLLNENLTQALLEKSKLADTLEKLNLNLEEKVKEQVADLCATNERLTQSERMKDLLTGTLVHDIKNQLFSIAAGISAIEQGTDLPEKAKEQLMLTSAACEAAVNLSVNMLDIGKMEENKLSVQMVELRASDLVLLVERYRGHVLFADKKIKVIIAPTPPGYSINADPYLLDRILQNLFHNAAMYTLEDGEVKVTFGDNGAMSIENSSTPIPLKVRATIFDKYARTLAGNSKYSKGLGLFFCKMAMEAQGGTIELTTTEESNCFTLCFGKMDARYLAEQEAQ